MNWLTAFVEPLAPFKLLIDSAAAVASFSAAGFWFVASLIRPPTGAIVNLHPAYEIAVRNFLTKQGRWNGYAAGLTALASLLTGVSVLIGTRWG